MSPAPNPDDLATHEEIRQAIADLTPEEHGRIGIAAERYRRGSEYESADDLLNEAFIRMLNGAVGGDAPAEKYRHLRKGVELTAFLIKTMQGLANDSRTSAQRRDTFVFEPIELEGNLAIGVDGPLIDPDGDPLAQALYEERRAQAQADLERLDTYFAGDTEVEVIILGRKEGDAAASIIQKSGMTQHEYEAASKRLRRGWAKLFPSKG